MNKKQKILKLIKSEVGLFVVLVFVIVGLFVILSPKVSSMLFPVKRQAILNEFINKTKVAGKVDPQGYWQFREFYSPGYFNFAKSGISKPLVDNARKEIGITYDNKKVDLTPLSFSSRWLNSLDMFTKQTDLTSLVDQKQIQKKNVLFMGKNSLIYKEDDSTIKIIFLLSNSDMQKANGFFDYQDKDKNITKGENWFNVTSLKSN